MKKEGHPPYQDILFVDTATGFKFVCGSTLQPSETEVFEGKEYPVYRVPISSASHPFFTGAEKFVDTEGRIDKFRNRYNKKPEPKKAAEPAAPAPAPKKAAPKKKAPAAPKKTASIKKKPTQ